MNRHKNLGEIYFIVEMRELCQDALFLATDRLGAGEQPQSFDLPNGGSRYVVSSPGMDVGSFWNERGVMKVFMPDLAEKLGLIKSMRNISEFLADNVQKPWPLNLSSIRTPDEMAVMSGLASDYFEMTGQQRRNENPKWRADIRFILDMSYNPDAKQGSPFNVSSVCEIRNDPSVARALKIFEAAGMNDQALKKLESRLDYVFAPTREFLVSGEPPESMEDFREKLSEAMSNTWLVPKNDFMREKETMSM